MAIAHAQPGQAIDVQPLGERLRDTQNHALIKTRALELIRIALHAGQRLQQHHAPHGEVTLHCIEGSVQVETASCGTLHLRAGQLVLLPAGERPALLARADGSVLMTVPLPPGWPGSDSSTG